MTLFFFSFNLSNYQSIKDFNFFTLIILTSQLHYSVTESRSFCCQTINLCMYGYQLVDKIGTKSEQLHECFRGPAIQWDWLWCWSIKPIERSGSGKSKMAASKLKIWPPSWISYFQFGRKLFQSLPLARWTTKHMWLSLPIEISFLSCAQAEMSDMCLICDIVQCLRISIH